MAIGGCAAGGIAQTERSRVPISGQIDGRLAVKIFINSGQIVEPLWNQITGQIIFEKWSNKPPNLIFDHRLGPLLTACDLAVHRAAAGGGGGAGGTRHF